MKAIWNITLVSKYLNFVTFSEDLLAVRVNSHYVNEK